MLDTELYAQLLGIKSPWSVSKVDLKMTAQQVDIHLQHGEKVDWECPTCSRKLPCRDHVAERTWRHLDSCQFKTLVHARIPRVECPEHGVIQVNVPWAAPKSRFTLMMERFCIDVLSSAENITGASAILRLSWDEMQGIMERAVKRELARKASALVPRLCVDEKAFKKGHCYSTIICDADHSVVEHVSVGRTIESLSGYYRSLSAEQKNGIQAIGMDMWEPYVTATEQEIPLAESIIVHDRFHVMMHMNKAVDQVRLKECRELVHRGDKRLTGTKHWWLYAHENLPERHREAFASVKAQALKVSKAWAIKEALRKLWQKPNERSARGFFGYWYRWAMKSGLKAVQRVAEMVKARLRRVINYVRLKLTNGVAEGINSRIMTIKRRACGYRNQEHFKTAIFFFCGGLDLYPGPPTHTNA